MDGQVLAVVQHKGGVGKTVVTVNLAAAMARFLGLRVVILDLDGQRNATTGLLGWDHADLPAPTIEHYLRGSATLDDVLHAYPGDDRLQIIPGSIRSYHWMRETTVDPDAAKAAADAVRDELTKRFDVVLIDTPPSETVATEFALIMADGYLMPAQPDLFSISGIRDTIEMAEAIHPRNMWLRAIGVVINQYRGFKDERPLIDDLRDQYGDLILDLVIPMKVEHRRWAIMHEPLVYAPPGSVSGHTIYRLMAEDVWSRLKSGFDGTAQLATTVR